MDPLKMHFLLKWVYSIAMLVYQRVNESKFLWSLKFHRNRQGFYQYDEKRRHQRDPDAERLLQEVGFQKKRQVVGKSQAGIMYPPEN